MIIVSTFLAKEIKKIIVRFINVKLSLQKGNKKKRNFIRYITFQSNKYKQSLLSSLIPFYLIRFYIRVSTNEMTLCPIIRILRANSSCSFSTARESECVG